MIQAVGPMKPQWIKPDCVPGIFGQWYLEYLGNDADRKMNWACGGKNPGWAHLIKVLWEVTWAGCDSTAPEHTGCCWLSGQIWECNPKQDWIRQASGLSGGWSVPGAASPTDSSDLLLQNNINYSGCRHRSEETTQPESGSHSPRYGFSCKAKSKAHPGQHASQPVQKLASAGIGEEQRRHTKADTIGSAGLSALAPTWGCLSAPPHWSYGQPGIALPCPTSSLELAQTILVARMDAWMNDPTTGKAPPVVEKGLFPLFTLTSLMGHRTFQPKEFYSYSVNVTQRWDATYL